MVIMAASFVRSPVVYDLEGEDFLSKFKLQFEKVLDVGMCGEIVLAIPLQKPNARRVVKKFSLLDEDSKASSQLHFECEVKFMQSFDHRNLMKCIIAGKSPEYLAICMPYYWRGTLDCYIGDVGLQQSEILVTQVACALRYLHRNNVAHLDVKLDNIFLDDDFNAILGDFGLAVELPKERRTLAKGKCGGTRAYFAPERIGAPESTELDVYKVSSHYFFFYIARIIISPRSSLLKV